MCIRNYKFPCSVVTCFGNFLIFCGFNHRSHGLGPQWNSFWPEEHFLSSSSFLLAGSRLPQAWGRAWQPWREFPLPLGCGTVAHWGFYLVTCKTLLCPWCCLQENVIIWFRIIIQYCPIVALYSWFLCNENAILPLWFSSVFKVSVMSLLTSSVFWAAFSIPWFSTKWSRNLYKSSTAF